MSVPKHSGRPAYMEDVYRVLRLGGRVVFIWSFCATRLVSPSGEWYWDIDGRTYQGFLKTLAPTLVCTEVGSTETKDLVITWMAK